MFIVTGSKNGKIGILDDEDGIIEYLDQKTVLDILSKGIKIQGLVVKNTEIYLERRNLRHYLAIFREFAKSIASEATRGNYESRHLNIRLYFDEYDKEWRLRCFGNGKINWSTENSDYTLLSEYYSDKIVLLIRSLGIEPNNIDFDFECQFNCGHLENCKFNGKEV